MERTPIRRITASTSGRNIVESDVRYQRHSRRTPGSPTFLSEPAANLLSRAERGEIQGFACATTVTTIFYLVRKAAGLSDARRRIGDLLSVLDVAPVNRAVLERAASSGIGDFEDAVIVESARQVDARVILTRNERDFAKSSISVHSPESLLALLDAVSGERGNT